MAKLSRKQFESLPELPEWARFIARDESIDDFAFHRSVPVVNPTHSWVSDSDADFFDWPDAPECHWRESLYQLPCRQCKGEGWFAGDPCGKCDGQLYWGEPVIQWPDDVEPGDWVAVDENGRWYNYGCNDDLKHGGCYWFRKDFSIGKCEKFTWPEPAVDWKDSLMQRPALDTLPSESKDGVSLIATERKRQVSGEGYSDIHDDSHDDGQIAKAAAIYAMPGTRRRYVLRSGLPYDWPWEAEWWKPTPEDRVRELVKAGALIAAEIDRLQRLNDELPSDSAVEDDEPKYRPFTPDDKLVEPGDEVKCASGDWVVSGAVGLKPLDHHNYRRPIKPEPTRPSEDDTMGKPKYQFIGEQLFDHEERIAALEASKEDHRKWLVACEARIDKLRQESNNREAKADEPKTKPDSLFDIAEQTGFDLSKVKDNPEVHTGPFESDMEPEPFDPHRANRQTERMLMPGLKTQDEPAPPIDDMVGLNNSQKVQLLLDENLRLAQDIKVKRMYVESHELDKKELREYAGDLIDPDGSHCIFASAIVYFKNIKDEPKPEPDDLVERLRLRIKHYHDQTVCHPLPITAVEEAADRIEADGKDLDQARAALKKWIGRYNEQAKEIERLKHA